MGTSFRKTDNEQPIYASCFQQTVMFRQHFTYANHDDQESRRSIILLDLCAEVEAGQIYALKMVFRSVLIVKAVVKPML
jgi:hypothetical protein